MFTKGDLTKEDINGESYETFQPNTIMYAVPSTSKLASTMRKRSKCRYRIPYNIYRGFIGSI